MRYYLYISDSKVDMLFPQVPGAVQQGVAKKLGFDLKLISGSIESQKQTFDSRVARLQAVEEHIRSFHKIGAPTDETPWVGGEIMVQVLSIAGGAILFVNREEPDYFVLGGSADHVIGNTKADRPAVSYSSMYQISRFLSELHNNETILPDGPKKRRSPKPPNQYLERLADNMKCIFAESVRQPPQRIEFLAKRLSMVDNRYRGGKMVFATPLYVALAD